MSTEYNNYSSVMIIECDICGAKDNYSGDFKECISHFKENGWKFGKNVQGEWLNFCSTECKEKGV